MRKVHFSTPQQVEQYLKITLEIVESPDVPDDLREAAFTAVFAAVTGAQVFFDKSDASGPILPAMAVPGSGIH